MIARPGGLVLLFLALGGRAAMAAQDTDLGLIPQGIEQLHASPAEPSEASDANCFDAITS